MQCHQCQHENSGDAKFCNQCATPFVPVCSACGYDNATDAKFCNQCGTQLTSVSAGQREIGAESRFYSLLRAVAGLVQRERRVTYRELKYIFGLDDALLEEIREELDLKQLAIADAGKVLVWTVEPSVSEQITGTLPSQQSREVLVATPPSLSTDATEIEGISNGSIDAPASIPISSPAHTPDMPFESAQHTQAAERRQVTIMFADISGFTAMSETMDPEAVRNVMNDCFACLVPIVESYQGTIDKFIGDEIMALFGAPIAHERAPEHAIRAALEMTEALERFNAEHETDLGLHFGINTGLVIAGGIGTSERQDYSVMGDAVNLAARLEDASERDEIFVGPDTYRLTQSVFEFEPLEPMSLKGKTERVPAYRVHGLRESVSDWEGLPGKGFVELVGREEEIGLLQRRWEQSKAGQGQVVLLSGEAGIGKSSLVNGLRNHLHQEEATRITFRCSPYHANSAFYPVITYLERMLGLNREESAEAKLAKLEQALRSTLFPVNDALPLLATFIAIPLGEQYSATILSPQQQRQRTLDLLVNWMLEEAGRQPILAVWEDLHWADPSTLELLGLLIDQTPMAPILNVLSYRPEFELPWVMRSHMTPITLNHLARAQVRGLIAHLTSGKGLPEEVIDHIVAKTDGVPLYVEELTKMLMASNILSQDQDQYVLAGPLSSAVIPETLQDSLMARLDQLNKAKEVAQLGAVLGREFTYEILQAIASQDEPTLRSGLGQLVNAELLYQRGRFPQSTYVFKHALIRDAAYNSLLRSQRRQYHRQIAEVLEVQFLELVENHPELLARHCTEAELYEQAVDRWHQAGQQTMQRSAYHEAQTCFEQAIDNLRHVPKNRKALEQAIDLRFEFNRVLAPLWNHDRMRDNLQDAVAFAEELDDSYRLGSALARQAQVMWFAADLDNALATGERAVSLIAPFEDQFLVERAKFILANIHFSRGDFGHAADIFRGLLKGYRGDLIPKDYSSVMSVVERHRCLGNVCAEMGLFGEGMAMVEKAVHIAEAHNQPYAMAGAYDSAGYLSLCQNDLTKAIGFYTNGLETCQRWHLLQLLHTHAIGMSLTLALSGQQDDASALLEREVGYPPPKGLNNNRLLGEAYLLAGNAEAALGYTERMLESARANGERGAQAWSLRLLGEIYANRNSQKHEQAKVCYLHALDLASECGMRPLQAHCHRGLGTLHGQIGQAEQARAELTTALEMYRDMEMAFWLPETEAMLSAAGKQ